ncbi:MAG: ribonuclease III [Thermoleophilia bacterium]|nr:ribonuclease III [Thermoleophilia bacterium]
MGMRGLPAVVRAVPARLFQRPPRSGTARPLGGRTLLELIAQLPPALRDRALTHSSWVETRLESYERLEFLGDSVLGLAVASELGRRYPQSDEGDLARMKGFIVSRATCAEVAARIDLRRIVLEQAPAAQAKREEMAANQTILGNLLEALIGACYLTHGFEQTRLGVVDAFDAHIGLAATTRVDHKTALQELLAPRGLQPVYRVVAEEGPPHARVFTSEVYIDGAARGKGTGTTIKMSEQGAAGEALDSPEVTGPGR